MRIRIKKSPCMAAGRKIENLKISTRSIWGFGLRKLENLIITLFVVGFVFIPRVFAAEFNISSNSVSNKVGDEFMVRFTLDTEDETINAVEGNLVFPQNLVSIKEIREGNSIMSLWIKTPQIQNENEITFSGIVPGGYIGDKGEILSVVLIARGIGNGEITTSQVKSLISDGIGTSADIKIKSLQVTIEELSESDISKKISMLEDTEPPETFEPKIFTDKQIYDGKNFIVFYTLDKISGIDRFEIKEGDGIFKVATSPYLLENQNLDKNIEVKAIDKSGNERSEIVYLDSGNVQLENKPVYIILLPISLLILSIFFVYKKLWLRS